MAHSPIEEFVKKLLWPKWDDDIRTPEVQRSLLAQIAEMWPPSSMAVTHLRGRVRKLTNKRLRDLGNIRGFTPDNVDGILVRAIDALEEHRWNTDWVVPGLLAPVSVVVTEFRRARRVHARKLDAKISTYAEQWLAIDSIGARHRSIPFVLVEAGHAFGASLDAIRLPDKKAYDNFNQVFPGRDYAAGSARLRIVGAYYDPDAIVPDAIVGRPDETAEYWAIIIYDLPAGCVSQLAERRFCVWDESLLLPAAVAVLAVRENCDFSESVACGGCLTDKGSALPPQDPNNGPSNLVTKTLAAAREGYAHYYYALGKATKKPGPLNLKPVERAVDVLNQERARRVRMTSRYVAISLCTIAFGIGWLAWKEHTKAKANAIEAARNRTEQLDALQRACADNPPESRETAVTCRKSIDEYLSSHDEPEVDARIRAAALTTMTAGPPLVASLKPDAQHAGLLLGADATNDAAYVAWLKIPENNGGYVVLKKDFDPYGLEDMYRINCNKRDIGIAPISNKTTQAIRNAAPGSCSLDPVDNGIKSTCGPHSGALKGNELFGTYTVMFDDLVIDRRARVTGLPPNATIHSNGYGAGWTMWEVQIPGEYGASTFVVADSSAHATALRTLGKLVYSHTDKDPFKGVELGVTPSTHNGGTIIATPQDGKSSRSLVSFVNDHDIHVYLGLPPDAEQCILATPEHLFCLSTKEHGKADSLELRNNHWRATHTARGFLRGLPSDIFELTDAWLDPYGQTYASFIQHSKGSNCRLAYRINDSGSDITMHEVLRKVDCADFFPYRNWASCGDSVVDLTTGHYVDLSLNSKLYNTRLLPLGDACVMEVTPDALRLFVRGRPSEISNIERPKIGDARIGLTSNGSGLWTVERNGLVRVMSDPSTTLAGKSDVAPMNTWSPVVAPNSRQMALVRTTRNPSCPTRGAHDAPNYDCAEEITDSEVKLLAEEGTALSVKSYRFANQCNPSIVVTWQDRHAYLLARSWNHDGTEDVSWGRAEYDEHSWEPRKISLRHNDRVLAIWNNRAVGVEECATSTLCARNWNLNTGDKQNLQASMCRTERIDAPTLLATAPDGSAFMYAIGGCGWLWTNKTDTWRLVRGAPLHSQDDLATLRRSVQCSPMHSPVRGVLSSDGAVLVIPNGVGRATVGWLQGDEYVTSHLQDEGDHWDLMRMPSPYVEPLGSVPSTIDALDATELGFDGSRVRFLWDNQFIQRDVTLPPANGSEFREWRDRVRGNLAPTWRTISTAKMTELAKWYFVDLSRPLNLSQ